MQGRDRREMIPSSEAIFLVISAGLRRATGRLRDVARRSVFGLALCDEPRRRALRLCLVRWDGIWWSRLGGRIGLRI